MHTGTGLASAQDARIAPRGESGLGDRKLRQLALAVLASLVLHALILSVLASVREFARTRAAPPPLTARLAKPRPPPEPEKVEPLPPVVSPRAVATPKAAPRTPALAPVPAAPILSMEPARKAEAPALVVPVVPLQPAPRTEPRTQPVPAVASGPDPASVARYRLELMEIAQRYKRYPRIAQDNNWEGRVELRIAFSESGAMSLLSVKKGAGRAVLDEEAQAMIRSAQAQATIPPALRGKAFTIEIPVDFLLKEAR